MYYVSFMHNYSARTNSFTVSTLYTDSEAVYNMGVSVVGGLSRTGIGWVPTNMIQIFRSYLGYVGLMTLRTSRIFGAYLEEFSSDSDDILF